MTLLLSAEEEELFLQRSLKAALNSTAGLVPCPQAGCEGIAVAGGGACCSICLMLACPEVKKSDLQRRSALALHA